jgi:hypothetical protein
MKRITLALASLGFCAATFASLPAASSPSEIVVPQLPGGFTIGGTLLFLQPSINNGDLDYASSQSFSGSRSSAQLINSDIKRVEPGYDFGWGVNVGYEFPQTGNDVNLSYQHLNATSRDSAFDANGTIGPLHVVFSPISNNLFDQFATANANIKWNQVDLTAGQMINVGTRFNLHPNVGISYTDIKRTLDTSFYALAPQTQPKSNLVESHSDQSHYWGIGPMAGLDASYYLGDGLGIVTHLQGGVLAGDINDKVNVQFSDTNNFDGIPSSSFQISANTNFRIVPTYTAKAGADFTYHFNNSFASYLTAEAGYQVNEYFNAIDSITGTDNEPINPIIASGVASQQTANLFLDGPYANITLHL